MATPEQLASLKELYEQAKASEHIWPAMAACEACLESAWLTSELARDYNNLFGQKQSATPEFHTVRLPTEEVLNGHTFKIWASFVWFPTKASAFTERMKLLERLQDTYPEYKQALHAVTPEDYILFVSERWSTDPLRGKKVLEIYKAHQDVFA